jgi:uncharacterized membrane protein YphA (DoxX/SURF4 family)
VRPVGFAYLRRPELVLASRLGKESYALDAIHGALPGSHRNRLPSFLIAFFSDFVCGILLTIGLATRWAALYCFGNIVVAWAFVHHFAFLGNGPGPQHGELIFLYLAAMLTLFLAGAGAISLDRLLARKP